MNDTLLSLRPKTSNDDNMIPLINIVFLLLIFFMIAGTVTNQQSNEISPPLSTSEEPVSTPAILIELHQYGHLFINGEQTSLSSLSTEFEQKASQLTEAKVAVKADKSVKAVELDSLFNLLRSEGVTEITLFSKRAG